jgi:xanthine/uracil permease
MDLETFTREWRSAGSGEDTELRGEALMSMIQDETRTLRQRVQRRLRRETSIYLALVVGAGVIVIDRTTTAQLTALGVLFGMVGTLVATLWLGERTIAQAPLDGSVRETLRDLGQRIDRAGRAYLYAYVGVCASSMVILSAVVFANYGAGVWFVAALGVGAAGTAWAYASGQRYVDRIFRHDRAELSRCLSQLQ